MERDYKAEFLGGLRSLKEQEKKIVGIGTKSFSASELAHEVESDTELGNKLVEEYKRGRISVSRE